MAVRMAAATGNWLTAGTWKLVDGTSYNNSETTTTALTTAYQASSNFTPGAITIDGIAVKLSVRTGTTGTISVHLATAGVEKAGTLVTINVADLPAAVTADLNGGWVLFKFAAPVLLAAATNYAVEAKTSSNGQVSLFSTATTNWARALRTTTTGAPAEGDDLITSGEYTGAGTSNQIDVTMNALESSILDYGAGSTSQVTPAIAVCSKSSLRYGNTAATAYYLKVSGWIIAYAGGDFGIPTMPRDSTAKLNIDCVADGDFGITWRNLSIGSNKGLSRTTGKNVVACKLNTDEAVASTSLGVDTDTGWLDNDVIAVASTTRTATECEKGTLNGAAGASTLTVDGFAGAGGGLAAAHSGTSPTQAEVILLTRNVSIFGTSAAVAFSIQVRETAVVDFDWVEIYFIGSSGANKQGLQFWTTTGSLSITNCSFRDGIGFALITDRSNWSNLTFTNNVAYAHVLQVSTTTGTNWTIDSNIFIANKSNGTAVFIIADVGGTFTNNTAVGNTGGSGFAIGENTGNNLGTFSGCVAHSNQGHGFTIGGQWSPRARADFTSFITWRNNGIGLSMYGFGWSNSRLLSWKMFGNNTRNVYLIGYLSDIIFESCDLSGDTTFSTTYGYGIGGTAAVGAIGKIRFISCTFGVVTGIKTAHTGGDFDLGSSVSGTAFLSDVVLINCLLASATEVSTQGNQPIGSQLSSQKHDQTAGLHKTWKAQGTIAIETGTVHTGSQSLSLTPISGATATNKLESSPFLVAVANGATITPEAWIQKSAAYDGNQPRLVLKRNDAIGITADTVIATYASGTGSWNSISGVTPAATDDGVMEFVIDCDFGTGGVVYVDSLSAV